jgi:hypothetical protein
VKIGAVIQIVLRVSFIALLHNMKFERVSFDRTFVDEKFGDQQSYSPQLHHPQNQWRAVCTISRRIAIQFVNQTIVIVTPNCANLDQTIGVGSD